MDEIPSKTSGFIVLIGIDEYCYRRFKRRFSTAWRSYNYRIFKAGYLGRRRSGKIAPPFAEPQGGDSRKGETDHAKRGRFGRVGDGRVDEVGGGAEVEAGTANEPSTSSRAERENKLTKLGRLRRCLYRGMQCVVQRRRGCSGSRSRTHCGYRAYVKSRLGWAGGKD